MYKIHGFQDKDQLLETLVKENSMTFFPEFNLLAVTSSPALFRGPMSRETAIFNVTASEISSGEFFKGCDYVSDFVFKDGRDKAFAIIDSYEQDSDGFTFHDRRIDMLSRLFSWSSTITAGSIPDMVRRASYYQKHLMSNRESFELPAAIDQNRELAELVVSVATEPYMDPDKADMREQSIDSLCEEKTEVSESMRYGMEGVGLPMLDTAEHLANY